MDYKTIKLEKSGARARITLNRPEVLNAINVTLLDELESAFTELGQDHAVRVIVLDSACERAFSAGIDVAYVKDLTPLHARDVGRRLHEVFYLARTLSTPIIAVIDGLCLGAGLELALSSDIMLSSDVSEFGLPNINVGIPAIVEAAILPAAVGIQGARELCYTGWNWDAQKALARGLVNTVVTRDDLPAEVERWADCIASKSPWALGTQKEIIHQWMVTDLEAAIEFSINTVTLNWLTKDQKEGMGAFIEKRKAEFSGE